MSKSFQTNLDQLPHTSRTACNWLQAAFKPRSNNSRTACKLYNSYYKTFTNAVETDGRQALGVRASDSQLADGFQATFEILSKGLHTAFLRRSTWFSNSCLRHTTISQTAQTGLARGGPPLRHEIATALTAREGKTRSARESESAQPRAADRRQQRREGQARPAHLRPAQAAEPRARCDGSAAFSSVPFWVFAPRFTLRSARGCAIAARALPEIFRTAPKQQIGMQPQPLA